MRLDLRHLFHKPSGILLLLFLFGGTRPFPFVGIVSPAVAATVINSRPVSFAFPVTGADKVLSRAVSVAFSGTAMSKPVSVAFRTDDDCGPVTIAKVQGAINMYLGLKPVDSCVDVDGSGAVSIAEVQKVINAYLGL